MTRRDVSMVLLGALGLAMGLRWFLLELRVARIESFLSQLQIVVQ